MTTCRLEPTGLTEKTRELDDLKSGEVLRWRERWAALVNEHLAAHSCAERVDHRSVAGEGEVREPTFHKGPAVTAIERRAERSFVAERTREEVTERLRAAAPNASRGHSNAPSSTRPRNSRPYWSHATPGARDRWKKCAVTPRRPGVPRVPAPTHLRLLPDRLRRWT